MYLKKKGENVGDFEEEIEPKWTINVWILSVIIFKDSQKEMVVNSKSECVLGRKRGRRARLIDYDEIESARARPE